SASGSGSRHLGQLFLTLDAWGPLFVWVATGLERSPLVLLLPAPVARQMSYGVARVLLTMHAITAAQIFAFVFAARARPIDPGLAAIEVAGVYLMNLWLLLAARAQVQSREAAERALRVAQSSLQRANDQAAELASARRRAEAASEAKSEFLAHVSHEL